MATLTKISPYRMGPPRFGTKPYVFDNSVKTYQLTPEQLERYRNGKSLDDILKEEKEVEQQKPKVIAYAKYEEVVAERDELKKQLEELKQNTIDEDLKQECERIKQDTEHYKELFETTMSENERLNKEILILKNEVQKLKDLNAKLSEKKERSEESCSADMIEIQALRLYALHKLQKDVNSFIGIS